MQQDHDDACDDVIEHRIVIVRDDPHHLLVQPGGDASDGVAHGLGRDGRHTSGSHQANDTALHG